MTDLDRDLAELLLLLSVATEGPWRWSENGNILGHMPDGYDETREVGAIYTDDDETGAPNAPAIIRAVNFIRTHHAEIARDRARLEAADALLRDIRDSTFRSALLLRSMADRYLSNQDSQP